METQGDELESEVYLRLMLGLISGVIIGEATMRLPVGRSSLSSSRSEEGVVHAVSGDVGSGVKYAGVGNFDEGEEAVGGSGEGDRTDAMD